MRIRYLTRKRLKTFSYFRRKKLVERRKQGEGRKAKGC
jgi:hypothetical protein